MTHYQDMPLDEAEAQFDRDAAARAHAEYIATLSAWSRADLLRTCRAAGLTAHKLATNEKLAELLWNATAPMRDRRAAF